MIRLRKAQAEESPEILKIYRNIDTSGDFKPRWSEKYPNQEFIEAAISKGELYVCTKDGTIIACAVINDRFDDAYNGVEWNVNVESSEISIIHAFAVNSNFQAKGYGRKVFDIIKENALKNNVKSIRLDVIDGNTGAQKVFEKLGFEYVGTVEMYHHAVGLEKFHLYECHLK